MKKLIVLAMAVLLCMSMVLPVCAAEQEFVPSITYKDGLDVTKATMNGEDVGDCVIVTSIKEAKEASTDIHQDARDELLEVYEQLSNGSMKLPLDGEYVIIELVDISFAETTCVGATEHEHEAWLKQDGNTVTVDLGHLNKGLDLMVLTYNDGQWTKVENVTDNGDGTYSVEFEHFCPVAFAVEDAEVEEAPKTGDNSDIFLWLAVMLAAAAALVVVLVSNRRRTAK